LGGGDKKGKDIYVLAEARKERIEKRKCMKEKRS
jgi:hypothetical protein